VNAGRRKSTSQKERVSSSPGVSATLELIMPREVLLEDLKDDPRYQRLLTIVLVQFGEGRVSVQ
jgi:hypothetical protein